MTHASLHRALTACLCLASLFSTGLAFAANTVTLLPLPKHGVQPQTAIAADGTVHVVFLAGKAAESDVWHATLAPGARDLSQPVRVNRRPGSAVAVGTIRGAQCAMGRSGRLHVVWNAGVVGADGKRSMDVCYTHSDGQGGFREERGMMKSGIHLDGGVSVAADAAGHVHLVWHAAPSDTKPGSGEKARRVYVTSSSDDGSTFGHEKICSAADAGVCACCSLRATAMPDGTLLTLYREADGKGRGVALLRAAGADQPWTRRALQPWDVNACPMSSAFLLPHDGQCIAAWETAGAIWMADVAGAKPEPKQIAEGQCKHPSIAISDTGDKLITWAIGTGWQRGGRLAWAVVDRSGKMLDQGPAEGTKTEVPVWSHPAALWVKGTGFVVLH